MEYDLGKKEIKTNKVINQLDRFVIDFINILEKHGLGYVIISGYVAIVLGRSRATEDVDMFVTEIDFPKFVIFFNDLLSNGYECMNTSDPKEAFDMLGSHAIRFFEKGKTMPNIEFKFMKRDLDKYSFDNRIKLVTNEKTLFISPLELHIAFKLFLAADGTDEELQSDKDIEDARFVYKLFEDKLNKDTLHYFIRHLNVEKRMRWLNET